MAFAPRVVRVEPYPVNGLPPQRGYPGRVGMDTLPQPSYPGRRGFTAIDSAQAMAARTTRWDSFPSDPLVTATVLTQPLSGTLPGAVPLHNADPCWVARQFTAPTRATILVNVGTLNAVLATKYDDAVRAGLLESRGRVYDPDAVGEYWERTGALPGASVAELLHRPAAAWSQDPRFEALLGAGSDAGSLLRYMTVEGVRTVWNFAGVVKSDPTETLLQSVEVAIKGAVDTAQLFADQVTPYTALGFVLRPHYNRARREWGAPQYEPWTDVTGGTDFPLYGDTVYEDQSGRTAHGTFTPIGMVRHPALKPSPARVRAASTLHSGGQGRPAMLPTAEVIVYPTALDAVLA